MQYHAVAFNFIFGRANELDLMIFFTPEKATSRTRRNILATKFFSVRSKSELLHIYHIIQPYDWSNISPRTLKLYASVLFASVYTLEVTRASQRLPFSLSSLRASASQQKAPKLVFFTLIFICWNRKIRGKRGMQ